MKKFYGDYSERTVFYSIDETNHLQIPHPDKPEIFVLVKSTFKKDVRRARLVKQRPRIKGYSNPIINLGQRAYSFLLIQENDYSRINHDDLLGAITASLIGENGLYGEENVQLFVDGKIGGVQKERAKSLVSSICNIDISKINLRAGKDFDVNYPLVNMADAIAYFLFNEFFKERSSLRDLFNHPRRKKLLF